MRDLSGLISKQNAGVFATTRVDFVQIIAATGVIRVVEAILRTQRARPIQIINATRISGVLLACPQ